MKKVSEIKKIAKKLFKGSLNRDHSLNPQKVQAVISFIKQQPPHQALNLLKAYLALAKVHLKNQVLNIETSQKLTKAEIMTFKNLFLKKNYPIQEVVVKENPSIIAGLRINIGSNLWDLTIRGRLANFRKSLLAS